MRNTNTYKVYTNTYKAYTNGADFKIKQRKFFLKN